MAEAFLQLWKNYATLIIVIAVAVLYRCIWGYVTRAIVRNKGYKEDWFWWGFFFSIIALIVAICKPNYVNTPEFQAGMENASVPEEDAELQNVRQLREYAKLVQEGVITQEEFERKKAEILRTGRDMK